MMRPEETLRRQRRARNSRLLIALALITGLGVLAWNVVSMLGSPDALARPVTRAAARSTATIQPSPTPARPIASGSTAAQATATPTATSTPAPAYVDELYLATATATSGPDLAVAMERIPTSLLYMVRQPGYVELASSGEERLSKYVASGAASAVLTVAVIPGETAAATATTTPLTAAVATTTATPLAPVAATATTVAPVVVATVTATPATAPAPPPSPTPFTTVIYAAGANITIPKLNVVAPVYEGGVGLDGAPVIANGYALTHFYWSAKAGQAGNMVLYGHDDIQGNIFANLPAMAVGDRIYIDTSGAQGVHRYIYQVTGSQIVLPTDTWVMNPTTGPTITLLSCTPFDVDTHRIVIKGNLVEVDGHAVQLASVARAASGS